MPVCPIHKATERLGKIGKKRLGRGWENGKGTGKRGGNWKSGTLNYMSNDKR